MNAIVSVIFYQSNDAEDVELSLRSLFCQTYESLEVIIVTESSSPSCEIIDDIVKGYEDSKTIYILRHECLGLAESLSKAMLKASGDFVLFLASGDTYLPDRIQATVSHLLEKPDDIAAVYSDGYIINENGYRTSKFSSKYLRPIGKNIYKELLVGNWIPAMGVTYRKSALVDVGLFDENLKVEDYDLLLRISRKYHISYIDQKLFCYRVHSQSFTKNKSEFDESIQNIKLKHADFSSFSAFSSAIKNKNFSEALKLLGLLNAGLFLRLFVRKVQIRTSLQGFSYSGLLIAVIKKFLNRAFDLFKHKTLLLRGFDIGKGSRVKGKIKITGNKANIKIGSNVHILGDIRIIAEHSRIPEQIRISDNCVIDEGAVLFSLGGRIELGNKCFVGTNTTLQANGDVVVGEYTMIAANTSIFANNHITDSTEIPYWEQGNRFEGIEIGRNCWIGTNVVVLDGVKLGDNCIVGASCIVNGVHEDNSRVLAKAVVGRSN